jgi:hypothetical protein
LAAHEDGLLGLQVHAAQELGSVDSKAHYASSPAGTTEQDFEEDYLAAVRLPGVASRGQLAFLAPLIVTRRVARGASEIGGGVGDVNLSGRYDFTDRGLPLYLPGIAALAGITLPTGRPPDAAGKPLATDATGIGAYQLNAGLAVEQSFDAWLLSLYGIVAKRTPRTAQGVHSALGTQWTVLAAVAYVFTGGSALAVALSYTGEGNATVDGVEQANTSRRIPLVAVTAVAPLSEHVRIQGGLSLNPPLSVVGKNEIVTGAATLTLVYALF